MEGKDSQPLVTLVFGYIVLNVRAAKIDYGRTGQVQVIIVPAVPFFLLSIINVRKMSNEFCSFCTRELTNHSTIELIHCVLKLTELSKK